MKHLVTLGAVLAIVAGCTEELNPGRCKRNEDCQKGWACDQSKRCVDLARVDAGDARRDVAGAAGDGPDASDGGDGDAPEVGPVLADDGGVEMAGPDAPGSCSHDDHCMGMGSTTVCAAGRCVACTQDSHCGDPVKRFCEMNMCVDCVAAPGICATKGGDKKHCGSNGACVECLEATQCTTTGKAFCVANSCVGCGGAPGVCKAPTPVCDDTGGTCVECTAASHCSDPAKPFCAGNRCVPCNMAPAGQTCAMLAAARPVCGPMGACVECNASADCTAAAAKPICQTSTCVPCTSDAQCAAKPGASPGVCLAHLDGRCATEAETIHVRRGEGCGDAGTMAQPACNLDAARAKITGDRRLVLVHGPAALDGFDWTLPAGGPVSIIGLQSAAVSGGTRVGARFSGTGEVYMRDLTVSYSMLQGIVAGQGTTLRLDRMTVQNNGGGGILLDRARFDIRNTLVSKNGPGRQGAQILWGGILVESPPAGGPARLERVSAVSNEQVGISCSSAIEGTGVLASGNVGGVETTDACGLNLCTPGGAGCGFSQGGP